MGLQWIHCRNTQCYHYDAKYTEKMKRESAAQFSEAVGRLSLYGNQGDVLDDEDDLLEIDLDDIII